MPLHDVLCDRGHRYEAYIALADLANPMVCDCGAPAQRVFLTPPMGRVEKVEYVSPIDGRPITTKYSRLEDMARNNCVEYDPGMKDDYLKRQMESEQAIDRKVEAIVESEIHGMGARKRERLEAEMRGGADVAFERSTAEG